LRISQPGVSYHLGKLEAALRTSLFHRGPAGLSPTPAGEILVERARALLQDLDRLEREVRAVAAGDGQTLRVSSACFTNYHWLPAVIQTLRSRHGHVRVELNVDPSRRPFEELDRGALDLALTTVPPEGSAFEPHELFDDEIVAVVRPGHPFADRAYLDPQDFADQSVVVFDRSRSDLFNLALGPAGVTPRDVTDVPVTEAILELVRAGPAVSAMASWVAWPYLSTGRLKAVRIGPDGLHRTWWAVLSARRAVPSSAVAFLEVLREVKPRRSAVS
ncbi:MAG TPA: LysR family transcriptional regulator, partial [Longimicrobiales bacterium]